MRCPRCRHENRETARFCGECGVSFDRDERKQVTVLFADMVDSMRLAERVDAEEWRRVLGRFLEILGDGVHRFEGTVNQFTGDGIMALFGAPVAHEDHAARACHAALQLLEQLDAYASTLRARGLGFSVRMGINSGEVVVGRIGDDLRMDYTALGHAVGLAARMEQLAAPGTIWLTEHTAKLVEGLIALRDRGTVTMKGVSAPVRVFEVQGVGALRTRLDVSGMRGFSRLVGRDGELAWLDHLVARAVESDGQVVGVIGDAGLGKSRLCLEFVQRCRTRGIAVHEAHCPAHGTTVPLLAIRELARSLFALGNGDPPEAARHKVANRLLTLDAGFEDAIPLVLDLLGIPGSDAPAAPAASPPEQLASFLRRLPRALGKTEPVVLLLDDLHWIDHASGALVGELAAGMRGTRALLVANFRPEYQPPWARGANYSQLSLSPLGDEASRALLDDLLGPDRSLSELTDRIRERTGGNPFFIEETVRALAASGSLAGQRGAYRLTTPVAAVVLPTSVQALLAARIDRLSEHANHALQVAAVIGRQFDEALLTEVGGLGPDEAAAALSALEEAEFIYRVASPHTEFAFKHPLTREVAYHSQLAERRSRLHAAAAAALEKLRADRLGEYAALIAHHWEASGKHYEATRWRRRAALKVSSIMVRGRRRTPAP